MRLKSPWHLLALSLVLAGGAGKAVSKPVAKTFQNPILTGFHPDPSLCRVGDDFYLTNSTFEFFPGLPLYHSRDLVHWELIGNALTRPSQLPLKGASDSGGLYAPTLRYWKGTFYLVCDNVSGGGNFIVTAKDPKGPWSEPVWLGDYGIDGSLFFDDDGKIYYHRAGADNGNGIAQGELDPDTLKLKGPLKKVWEYQGEWNEGPHLYKVNGTYYMISATGGTESHHQEVVARSLSPWGPFESSPHNPMLTERDDPKSPIQCAGHADLVEAPDGTWWAVFLGTRPHKGMSALGRETFLAPVTWTKDGWPIVGKDHHVALEMEAPKLKPFDVATVPPKTVFDGSPLGPQWLHIRNYDPNNFSFVDKHLRIRAAKDSLNNRWEEPAFVGQRQPAFRFSARTEMEFKPTQDGEEAGLCVRANEGNHYEIGIRKSEGKNQLFVRNRIQNREYLMAQEPVTLAKVQLEIIGSEEKYQFSWSADGKTWKTLAASLSNNLSREKAGGFTGTVIGLYATANGKDSKAYADFAWFETHSGGDLRQAPLLEVQQNVVLPTPLAPSDHWRILTSREDYKDKAGLDWSWDVGYSGGDQNRSWNGISGTNDPELFQHERNGKDFSYALPVLPGKYQVRLKFAETAVKNKGERVFDVLINGKKVLAKFDILQEVGGTDKALEKTFKDIGPDANGLIILQFVASVQNAKVCAIEIERQ